MHKSMTIGELASRLEIKDSTIRFYEREGLLKPDGRTSGNYRLFSEAALGRLRFIRAAQAGGLALEDIRTLLDVRDGTVSPCREVRAVIEARLAHVDEQMKHLRHVQSVLESYRAACEATERGEPCPVLDDLEREDP